MCHKNILKCNTWNNCHQHLVMVRFFSIFNYLQKLLCEINNFIDDNIIRNNANEREIPILLII